MELSAPMSVPYLITLFLPYISVEETWRWRHGNILGERERHLAENLHPQAAKPSWQKYYFLQVTQWHRNTFKTLAGAIDELITLNHQTGCKLAQGDIWRDVSENTDKFFSSFRVEIIRFKIYSIFTNVFSFKLRWGSCICS